MDILAAALQWKTKPDEERGWNSGDRKTVYQQYFMVRRTLAGTGVYCSDLICSNEIILML